ncbi:MAG: 4Fe-4S cluster-binding domain-containing protein, partial [Ruminiclostridium sp.]|nr:4Fe-4S cluster-binding domain-containing protein [Ruminiclostridium sp.]
MTDIYGLTYDRLCEELSRIGEKPSRAGVIYPAIYRELISDLSELRLNASSVSAIKENFTLGVPECVKLQNSEAADKYLFALSDGYTVESVLMKHEFGYNICVSTQVGCNMGCRFCMSGRLKRRRDLTAGEMTGQYIAIRRLSGHEINGISIMGTGEPMENLGNVLDFIRILTHGKGAAVGVKHITVSTCGIPEGIRKLALSDTPVNL